MTRRSSALAALALASCARRAPAPHRASMDDPALARPPALTAALSPPRARTHSATLENGLHVIVAPTPARDLRVTLVLRRGVDEAGADTRSLADLALRALARHMSDLTADTPAGRVQPQSWGSGFGADRASVHQIIAPTGLGASLWAVASALRQPEPSADVVTAVRDVLLRDIELRNPVDLADEARAARAQRALGLACEGLPATADVVRATPPDAVSRWLRERLAPDTVALIVQGPVTRDAVMAYVERLFATWRPPAPSPRAASSPIRLVAEPAGVTLVAAKRRALVQTRLFVTLPVASPRELAAAYAFSLLWCLWPSGRTGRMLRDGYGEVYATAATLRRDGDVATVSCDTRVGAAHAAHAVAAMRDAAASLASGGVDAAELDVVRRVVHSQAAFSFEVPSTLSDALYNAAVEGVSPERESPTADALRTLDVTTLNAYLARAVRVDHAQAFVFGPLDELPVAAFEAADAGVVRRVPAAP